MPTYRYECLACREVHEVFHSINEEHQERCPVCGGKLQRLIGGGGGILLKGSGFHTTDYRSDSYRRDAKEEKGDKGGGEASPSK